MPQLIIIRNQQVISGIEFVLINPRATLLAATSKFEVKRSETSGHRNDCIAVSLRDYYVSNCATAAFYQLTFIVSRFMDA